MMFFKFICLVGIYLQGVQSVCDPNVIDGIKKFWNNKPPTNILARYDGTWTVVKISSENSGVDSHVKCVLETARGIQSTAKDYWFFNDPTEDFSLDIKLIEKPGIIVEQYTAYGIDHKDSMHVLYFDHGVMGFWTCSQDVDGFTGITVKDYAETKNDPKTKEAIHKAEESLNIAGLPDIQEIHTDCPTNPATAWEGFPKPSDTF